MIKTTLSFNESDLIEYIKELWNTEFKSKLTNVKSNIILIYISAIISGFFLSLLFDFIDFKFKHILLYSITASAIFVIFFIIRVYKIRTEFISSYKKFLGFNLINLNGFDLEIDETSIILVEPNLKKEIAWKYFNEAHVTENVIFLLNNSSAHIFPKKFFSNEQYDEFIKLITNKLKINNFYNK